MIFRNRTGKETVIDPVTIIEPVLNEEESEDDLLIETEIGEAIQN